MQALRSYRTVGIALVGAGAIALTPVSVSDATNATVRTAVELTALDIGGDAPGFDPGVFDPSGGGFDLGNLADIQSYAEMIRTIALAGAGLVSTFGHLVDPLLGLIGVTGVGNWLVSEADLVKVLFSPNFDPDTWVNSFNATALVSPVGHFNLPDWLLDSVVQMFVVWANAAGGPDLMDNVVDQLGLSDAAHINEALGMLSGVWAAGINSQLGSYGIALGYVTEAVNGHIDPDDPAVADHVQSTMTTFSEGIYSAVQALYPDLFDFFNPEV